MTLGKRFYSLLGARNQMLLDRMRYQFRLLPRINRRRLAHICYPQAYKAAVTISADFELAWAWRYDKRVSNPLEYAQRRAQRARRSFPELLVLFDCYEIPVTWAVVGHLFLERCERQNGRPHPEILRPPYFENEHWRYTDGDWFDADPCSDYQHAPDWYAPDLIRAILSAKVEHELACHTFSHIDCSDAHCPPEVMDSELAECKRVAEAWGIAFKSFVFPGNLVGNRASLKRYGFAAYRWHSGYELDVPRQDKLGLWQIPGGVCWEKPEGWPVDAWIGALWRCVDRALETRTVLHFWFHPSCEPINMEAVFPALLDHVAAQRSDLWLTTMAGLVDWLTSVGE